MKVKGNLKKLTSSQLDLSKAMGLTPPRIHQLIQEGIIIRDENDKTGGVFIFESLVNYFKGKKQDNDADLEREKALHEKAKREYAELKLLRAQNELYDARTVEQVMIEQYVMLRTNLLGMPSKLAAQLEGKDKDEIYELMTREIESKLSELSTYSPDLFSNEVIDDEEQGISNKNNSASTKTNTKS